MLALVDLTVGDFLLIVLRTLVSIFGAAYLVAKSFRLPDVKQRDIVWCERWIAIAFGVIAIIVGSMVIALLQRRASIPPRPVGSLAASSGCYLF
jgi:hypothetical protein